MKNIIRNFTAEAAISPYRLIKFGTNDGYVMHGASAADSLMGVSTEVDADANTRADVVLTGMTHVEYGGNIAKSDPLTSDANGKAIKATASSAYIAGYAIVSGAAGDIGEMVISRSRTAQVAANQAASTASTVAAVVTDFNALLTKLKAAGIMTAD